MGWLSLYIGSSTLPAYYASRIGIYRVKIKRLQAGTDDKWSWQVNIRNNGQSSNMLSDKFYTDAEIQELLVSLLSQQPIQS